MGAACRPGRRRPWRSSCGTTCSPRLQAAPPDVLGEICQSTKDIEDQVARLLPDADCREVAELIALAAKAQAAARTVEAFQPNDDVPCEYKLFAQSQLRMRRSLRDVRAAQYELTTTCNAMAMKYDSWESTQHDIWEEFLKM